LTGAQIPLSQLRNDAVDNLMGALAIAGNYIIPGNLFYMARHFIDNPRQNVAFISITHSTEGTG
jgi:L-asparaginase/Glu-tRNA(Gln) amidotransferase subunit D